MQRKQSHQYRRIGSQLAEFIQSSNGSDAVTTKTLQGVVADLTASDPDIGPPLRDMVSRRSFQTLIPHTSSGSRKVKRQALIQEISQLYHPDVVKAIGDVLEGFLETSDASNTEAQHQMGSTSQLKVAPIVPKRKSSPKWELQVDDEQSIDAEFGKGLDTAKIAPFVKRRATAKTVLIGIIVSWLPEASIVFGIRYRSWLLAILPILVSLTTLTALHALFTILDAKMIESVPVVLFRLTGALAAALLIKNHRSVARIKIHSIHL